MTRAIQGLAIALGSLRVNNQELNAGAASKIAVTSCTDDIDATRACRSRPHRGRTPAVFPQRVDFAGLAHGEKNLPAARTVWPLVTA